MAVIIFAYEHPKSLIWWVAPTYSQAIDIGLRTIRNLGAGLVKKTSEAGTNPHIEFDNGSRVEFKSADRPDTLRGYSLDLLIVDEAGYVKDKVWSDVLRPTLVDRNGHAIIIGTPKGKNWFYKLYCQGINKEHNIESFTFSTEFNKKIQADEIKMMINSLPELTVRQEIYAEFLDDMGAIFRRVRRCIKGEFEEPNNDKRYVMGVDLAKYQDFTVITVLDNYGHLVYMDRFNQIDWNFQKERINQVYLKWKPQMVILDSTGVGDPINDDLVRAGLPIIPYNFTNETKKNLVQNLSIMIDKQEISFPNIEILISELEAYGYEITEAGNVRYGAPEGLHDDCVMSLGLAAMYFTKTQTRFLVGFGRKH
jgi:phage FluMu gp28-like protein